MRASQSPLKAPSSGLSSSCLQRCCSIQSSGRCGYPRGPDPLPSPIFPELTPSLRVPQRVPVRLMHNGAADSVAPSPRPKSGEREFGRVCDTLVLKYHRNALQSVKVSSSEASEHKSVRRLAPVLRWVFAFGHPRVALGPQLVRQRSPSEHVLDGLGRGLSNPFVTSCSFRCSLVLRFRLFRCHIFLRAVWLSSGGGLRRVRLCAA